MTINPYIIPGIKRIDHKTFILELIAELFNIEINSITEKNKKKELCYARHAYFYVRRKTSALPLSVIGNELKRGHATVIHSIEVAEDLMFSDKTFNKIIKEMLHRVKQFPVICLN